MTLVTKQNDSIIEVNHPMASPPQPSSSPFNIKRNYSYLPICLALLAIVVLITIAIAVRCCAGLRRQLDREHNNVEMLHQIPVFNYRKKEQGVGEDEEKDEEDATECVVCLSPLDEEEEVRQLPSCGHLFHAACIEMWLNSHNSCPICRGSVLLT